MTQAVARSIFSYDSATGVFLRNPREGLKRRFWGQPAGTLSSEGYLVTSVQRVQYKLHRVAWLFVYGETPVLIDHVNGDRSDNRIINLRIADFSQSAFNTGPHVDSASGLKGAHFQNGAWVSSIQVRGKRTHLGYFASAEDAHAAYVDAALKMHGEYARTI